MTFAKYNLRDNAFATLDAWIGASTTTITLTLWQGVRFPTSNAILTLVEYNTSGDPSSGVLKREKVLLTSRSSDILTVTRGFDWDTPTSFQAWDFIYLNVVSEIIEDIQDEVERLESEKLDKTTYNSTTRDNLTPYRLLYIDSSGAETELALWTAGQTLISQGATSNPIWQSPSLNITELTEDEVGNMENDEFAKTDGTGNKKIKLTRYRATDAEATAWTSTTKFVTPKQLSYWRIASSSTNIKASSDAEVTATWFSSITMKSCITTIVWQLNIVFDIRHTIWGNPTTWNLRVNWTSMHSWNISSSTYTTIDRDINVKLSDEISLTTSSGSSDRVTFVRNFRVRYDIQFWENNIIFT